MKIRLIKRYKLQHLYKEKGTILTVATSYGDELIKKGIAEDLEVKEVVNKEAKKVVNLPKKNNNNNDSNESTKK
tara:strand:+ start:91 stop:312 length:222 start_codon:yes stop_codon:yes gene_type:complete